MTQVTAFTISDRQFCGSKTFIMKSNLGTADKITRIVIALIVGVLYFTHNISGVTGVVLLIVATVLLLTVLINFCPIYFLLGLHTNKKSQ